MNTIYIVTRRKTVTEIIKDDFLLYLFIWFIVLAAVAAISIRLIKKATYPTEAAILSQKNFVAAASHELKAPLAVILTNAEAVAADSSLEARLKKNIAAIDSECKRMSNLVQDLLLLSSIDGGTWDLTKTPVDIFTLMITVYEKYETLYKKNDMKLNLNLKNDSYPQFHADKNRVEQILGIFLDNAVHYGNSGSAVNFTAEIENNFIPLGENGIKSVVFTVCDYGQGIKDEDKPFIFDRFFQANKSRTHTGHYGLGLSIAYELVKMHKGNIELSDTPEGGCTFRIIFPLS